MEGKGLVGQSSWLGRLRNPRICCFLPLPAGISIVILSRTCLVMRVGLAAYHAGGWGWFLPELWAIKVLGPGEQGGPCRGEGLLEKNGDGIGPLERVESSGAGLPRMAKCGGGGEDKQKEMRAGSGTFPS